MPRVPQDAIMMPRGLLVTWVIAAVELSGATPSVPPATRGRKRAVLSVVIVIVTVQRGEGSVPVIPQAISCVHTEGQFHGYSTDVYTPTPYNHTL